MLQAREPSQWNRESTTIRQFHNEAVVCYRNIASNDGFGLNEQSTHPNSS
jgi:hypothetical protein